MLLAPLYTSNKNEQFYKIVRPLSLLLKFLGFFPFQNSSSNNGLLLGYDRFTTYIHLVLTLLVYSIPSLYMILNVHNNFMMLSEAMITGVFVIMVFNCFYTDEYLLEIIHKFEKYDQFYIESKHTASCKRFKYRGFFYFLFIVFVIIIKATLIDHIRNYENETSDDVLELMWMTFIQNAPWVAMFSGFYVQLCCELSCRFEDLRQSITTDLTLPRIEEVRLLHGRLKDINDMINSCFGLRLSLYCLHFMHSFLHLFYKAVVVRKKITLSIFTSEIKKFILLYLTCYSSEFAVIQNRKLTEHLQAIPKNKMSSACKFQLELLIHESESSSFAITAWGMFRVDREMYATVFVVVVTYIITVLQIPPESVSYLLQDKNSKTKA